MDDENGGQRWLPIVFMGGFAWVVGVAVCRLWGDEGSHRATDFIDDRGL